MGNSIRNYKLVPACAWCQPDDWPVLKGGELYTSSICNLHKMQVLSRYARTKNWERGERKITLKLMKLGNRTTVM